MLTKSNLLLVSLTFALSTTLVHGQGDSSGLMGEIESLCQTLSPPSETKSSGMVERFSDDELFDLLKEEGYTGVKILTPGRIKIRMEGSTVILFNKEDGDLQLFYGVGGGKWGYEHVNEWNRTKRLSRAYLDHENDPVLESDLLSNGGLNQEKVKAFLKIFAMSKGAFRLFLLEKNQE